jgi:hypothetical protein
MMRIDGITNREPTDSVFATDSARAGKKRGKQPQWLAKVMQYHVQPLLWKLSASELYGTGSGGPSRPSSRPTGRT